MSAKVLQKLRDGAIATGKVSFALCIVIRRSSNLQQGSLGASSGLPDSPIDETLTHILLCVFLQRFGTPVMMWVALIMMLNMGIALTAEMTAIGDLFTQVGMAVTALCLPDFDM